MPDSRASSRYMPGDIVSVLLPLPLKSAYDYRLGPELIVANGDFVKVPLGSRQVTGVIWGPGSNEFNKARIKEVIARMDAPPISPVMIRFIEWVAAYTVSPKGAVLKMAMSVPAALSPPKPVVAYVCGTGPGDIRMTAARLRVLDALNAGSPQTAAELAAKAGVGRSVVRGLAEAGAIRTINIAPASGGPELRLDGHRLSQSQETIATDLESKVKVGEFSVSLLDGVPGSGKTEVYFRAISAALEIGRQVLILLPEIALSAQWLARFREQFGAAPAEWHSELGSASRRDTWRAVAEGDVRVVVGARSALFLPFRDIGLIIVDEEHDGSFKQEEGVIYNARDMAVVRASLGGFAIVLVSATPSLESVANADDGRYAHMHIAERHAGASLPAISAIDMRTQKLKSGNWLAESMKTALGQTFAAGEQAMLFLNRRGYAPLTLCRKCGHRLQCPNCTSWLVDHRHTVGGHLECHHCGYRIRGPRECPSCGNENSLAVCGPGVERLAEEASLLFPEVRTIIAVSDIVSGPKGAAQLVSRIENHQVDLIIGTQIIAKGYHFPQLTMVGVVDADLGLSGGDLRASERTFQLLYQVAGRAGRESKPGRVMLQTYMPEHPVMEALVSGDRESFIRAEAASRKESGMPPFGRLAALIVSSADERAADTAARMLARAAPAAKDVQVLGPAPAPLSLLRGRHRRRLLVKAAKNVNISSYLRGWLESVKLPGKVRVQADVDPYSFM